MNMESEEDSDFFIGDSMDSVEIEHDIDLELYQNPSLEENTSLLTSSSDAYSPSFHSNYSQDAYLMHKTPEEEVDSWINTNDEPEGPIPTTPLKTHFSNESIINLLGTPKKAKEIALITAQTNCTTPKSNQNIFLSPPKTPITGTVVHKLHSNTNDPSPNPKLGNPTKNFTLKVVDNVLNLHERPKRKALEEIKNGVIPQERIQEDASPSSSCDSSLPSSPATPDLCDYFIEFF
eukprot:TRINITY_DN1683_c1_g2_i2.p1 TRINITY_DN1683_c1_g2~~TRINITY_DN1683_c1_g2_i2.p1  ORF type:complete len:234 (-),score=37.10 TRINITY_DN1683_c1_g2_i2:302-1003(-)